MYTLAQLQVLKDNYAKGVLKVREADLHLDFDTEAGMRKRIEEIEFDLRDSGLLTTTKRSKIRTAKGRFCR